MAFGFNRIFRSLSRWFAASVVVATFLVRPEVGCAQVLNGFGGPSGYGLPCPGIEPCDDCSSTRISLSDVIPGGVCLGSGNSTDGGVPDGGTPTRYTDIYVNSNGNLTLGQPFRSFEPRPLPVAPVPMIAPFWADVDTRPDGRPANNSIFCHSAPGLLVVTWSNVGYFPAGSDRRNTFQAVLREDPSCGAGDIDVELRYGPLTWTSGSTSGGDGGVGGVAAFAGVDWGNGRDFITIPGSGTADVIRSLRENGNSEEGNGVWRWRIRSCDANSGCTDAGQTCSTGLPGICAYGSVRCNTGSPRTCVPALSPEREVCDGLDNNCNGRADEGMALCGPDLVCDRGRCLSRCLPELGCPGTDVCNPAGLCVEGACANVSCGESERCVAGRCQNSCNFVSCPAGLACRADRCVNPCEGVSCGPHERCESQGVEGGGSQSVVGVCRAICPCTPCGATEQCVDGRCVDNTCVGVLCPEGSYCGGGQCLVRCASARCPPGEVCHLGRCEPNELDGGVARDATTALDVVEDAADTADAGLPATFHREQNGCSCQAGAAPPRRLWGFALAFAVTLLWRRRRCELTIGCRW